MQVRQGCPTSPTLFNVYINDSMQEDGSTSVQVPGMRHRVPGLIFADENLILESSPIDMHQRLDSTRQGVVFNIKKCMLSMLFGDLDALKLQAIQLGVEVRGVGETYKYLGVTLDTTFFVKRIVKERVESGSRMVCALQPFLACHKISVWVRLVVVKAFLYPIVTYAAEIMGMHDMTALQPLQAIISHALKQIVGKSSKSTMVGASVLMRGFEVPPGASYCVGQRSRALTKYKDQRTWIPDLVLHEPRN